MSDYKGKVLLIVNVASKCGFTGQYEGLEKLYEKYKDQGFEVLGFPCNQFGGQEPGTAEEIQNVSSRKLLHSKVWRAKWGLGGQWRVMAGRF